MFNFRKITSVLLGASALVSVSAFADSGKVLSAANMIDRTVAPWAEMAGASFLTRDKKSIKMEGFTTNLEPNSTYTIWWVIYNKPELCVDGNGMFDEVGCGKDEVLDPELAEITKSSMLWGGGFISDAQGNAHFSAELYKKNPLGEVPMGPGLLKPKTAEVHFLIRSHGEMKVGMVKEQVSTMMANCMPMGDHACSNIQGSVHKADAGMTDGM
ncbi:hypothetical protein ACFL2V_05825 [Pseudomonadota bacterium]